MEDNIVDNSEPHIIPDTFEELQQQGAANFGIAWYYLHKDIAAKLDSLGIETDRHDVRLTAAVAVYVALLQQRSSNMKSRNAAEHLRQQARQAHEWNSKYPIGTEVIVILDDGRQLTTSTRSAAQVLPSGDAVIWLKNISGCYLLSRVSVMPEEI